MEKNKAKEKERMRGKETKPNLTSVVFTDMQPTVSDNVKILNCIN